MQAIMRQNRVQKTVMRVWTVRVELSFALDCCGYGMLTTPSVVFS